MKRLLILAALVALPGCTSPPIVDLKTIPDPVKYQDDLIQCHVLADLGYNAPAESAEALGKSVAGSLIMGTDPISGIVMTLVAAPMIATTVKTQMTAKCLHNRGYRIVNDFEMRMRPWQRCLDEVGQTWFTLTDECKARFEAEDRAWDQRFGTQVE